MDSDKAIGGLYLDADDFHHVFFCCLSGRWGGGETLPVFHWVTANHMSCLSAYETDWLRSQPAVVPFKYILHLSTRKRTQRIENKASLTLNSWCPWKNKDMNVERICRKMVHYSELCITLKHCYCSSTQLGQVDRLTVFLNSFSITAFLPYTPWLFTNIQAKLGYSIFNCCIANRIYFTAGWADKNAAQVMLSLSPSLSFSYWGGVGQSWGNSALLGNKPYKDIN